MNEDVCLLTDLVLGNYIQVGEGLVHECCDVSCLLQDLSVRVLVYELQQLVKNLLDVRDLLKVGGGKAHLGYQFLLLSSEPPLEDNFKLILLFLKLPSELFKPSVYTLQLQVAKAIELLLGLVKQLLVFIVDPASIQDHLLQV